MASISSEVNPGSNGVAVVGLKTLVVFEGLVVLKGLVDLVGVECVVSIDSSEDSPEVSPDADSLNSCWWIV